ncbi:hypothetical protein ACROYT_G009327 [Oculina patagonica]
MRRIFPLILLATLVCILVNVRKTEGQLSFNTGIGRSLYNRYARKMVSSEYPRMNHQHAVTMNRQEVKNQATRRRLKPVRELLQPWE